MNSNDFLRLVDSISDGGSSSNWLTIALILSIVAGIVSFFLFTGKKKPADKGFVAWAHDFLNFKLDYARIIIKVGAVILILNNILTSFTLIELDIWIFFYQLIVQSVIMYATAELLLLFITLVENTSEINKKIGKKSDN